MASPDKEIVTASYAAFLIAGVNLDFEQISNALRITPSRTRRAGEKDAVQVLVEDVWELKSPLEPTVTLNEHLDWLRVRLEPNYDFLHSLSACHLSIYCGLTLPEEQNWVSISARNLQMFVELQIQLDIGILCP